MATGKEKVIRILEELKNRPDLKASARKVVDSFYEQIDKPTFPSPGQIELAVKLLLEADGKDTKDYVPETDFGRCKAERGEQGFFVVVDDQQLGVPLTQKEAIAIARWLSESLDEIIEFMGGTATVEREAEIIDERDDLPF